MYSWSSIVIITFFCFRSSSVISSASRSSIIFTASGYSFAFSIASFLFIFSITMMSSLWASSFSTIGIMVFVFPIPDSP